MGAKRRDRPERADEIATLSKWAERHVGPLDFVADRSEDHGRALVLEFAGPTGRWFVKRAKDLLTFRREINAYREYLPHMTGVAPRLQAESVQHRALLITAVPGRGVTRKNLGASEDVHRRAGGWLAQLHNAAAPVAFPDLAAELEQRLRRMLVVSWHELDRPTVDYLTQVADRFAVMPELQLVPCHLDFKPRNWIVDDDGELGVIDFSGCDLGLVAEDLSKLANTEWTERPDLRAAFFEGYGRELDELELDQVECCTALAALASLTRGGAQGHRVAVVSSLRTLRKLQKPAGVAAVPAPPRQAVARPVGAAPAQLRPRRQRSSGPSGKESALSLLAQRVIGRFQRRPVDRTGS